MSCFRYIPRVLRIELILLAGFLVFYFLLGAEVSSLDNARVLGDPSEPGFKLTLIFLLIHFTLLVLLPVYAAVRLAGILWDWKLQSAGKENTRG